MPNRGLWVYSGIAGILATTSYILAITLPWPETQLGTSAGLVVVTAWPVLSIVYSYGLYDFVAAERQGTRTASRFSFRSQGSRPCSR